MVDISILKLLNLIVRLSDEERGLISTHDMFNNVRALIAKDADYIKVEDEKVCRKQLKSSIQCLAQCALDHLTGITATNKGMSNYISRLLDEHKVTDPIKIASAICALGNADLTYEVEDGVTKLRNHISETAKLYCEGVDGEEDYLWLNKFADNLVLYLSIAQIVCTFMIAKYGSESGVGEHFGQNVADTPTDLGNADDDHSNQFSEELAGTESYSLLEHYSLIIEGLETFALQGWGDAKDHTYAQRYAVGMLVANDILPANVEGAEGATWDKIKAGFVKAFKVIRDGLVSMKENYFDKSLEEMADDLKTASDENKKALAAVTQKDAVLTESAKIGIARLAEATGNDEIKTIVSSLTNVASAPNVIDKLMTVFTKVYNESQEIQKQFNEVDSNLKDLESKTNSNSPDDDDKEAISVAKQAITEKSKQVRDQFDELKKKLSDQRKQVGAISKAIKGIVPGIFYAEKKEGEKNE